MWSAYASPCRKPQTDRSRGPGRPSRTGDPPGRPGPDGRRQPRHPHEHRARQGGRGHRQGHGCPARARRAGPSGCSAGNRPPGRAGPASGGRLMPAAPSPRLLEIWLDARKVGELREQGNLWALRYEPSWQASGFDLSPALPRANGGIAGGAGLRPVQWFCDSLLPEEGSRRLLAQGAHLDPADAFGLLQHYGPESAGALALLAPDQKLPPPRLEPLPDAFLPARVRALPRLPRSGDAPKRMSLAGAQHKLAVVLHQDRLWEPVGSAATTHILKPDHERVDDYPHSAANEWFCMRLAADCGLDVPAVSIRRVPEPVYLVRRFDRAGEGLEARRLYALDACQVL